MPDRPIRAEELDINAVAEGYVVYDPGTDLVHYLNHTAAMVLELCTGRDTAAEIAAFLAEVFDSVPDVDTAITECIAQLRGVGLVQPACGLAPTSPAQSQVPDLAGAPSAQRPAPAAS